MKISEFIAKLQDAQDRYGDHRLSTWAGFVLDVDILPAFDGVVHPIERINEITMDLRISN